MRFPASTNAMGYFMPTPAANGGGSLVNEYTIICDLLYTNNATARPLVDTDGSLFVSGADFVISLNDGIGVTPNGPYDGVIAANTWYRVGISVTANEVHKFINGIEVGANAGTGLDGRLALNASAIIQYFNGDFSRYAMPSRRAVTQSPESSMLREICACTASTSSIKDGGLTMQPRKTIAATATTIRPR